MVPKKLQIVGGPSVLDLIISLAKRNDDNNVTFTAEDPEGNRIVINSAVSGLAHDSTTAGLILGYDCIEETGISHDEWYAEEYWVVQLDQVARDFAGVYSPKTRKGFLQPA